MRHCRPATTTYLPNKIIALLAFTITPLLIILSFAAGRITMLPMPAGVHEMLKFACCSRGLVFPQARSGDPESWYESKSIGYVDMLTEIYADENKEIRWALTPSVLQHVGSKSSKTNSLGKYKYQLTVPRTFWNFIFEENDVKQLRWEHQQQT
ncbi:hypothetical protein N7494_000496 [Penicillium frequentans]|uniref:Uncharacterized protein n=1 Tax=Penicillium frequentans TaxID=3151616 RepID=A0AAD6D656_9EURO|nr:hypothetical protein N7494_000496 [Penicillium glabrum]